MAASIPTNMDVATVLTVSVSLYTFDVQNGSDQSYRVSLISPTTAGHMIDSDV